MVAKALLDDFARPLSLSMAQSYGVLLFVTYKLKIFSKRSEKNTNFPLDIGREMSILQTVKIANKEINAIKLSKRLTEQIELLHGMDETELHETYGDMTREADSEKIQGIKLELAYLICAILQGKEPNEVQREKIYCHFQNLEMRDELDSYNYSKSTQRIIRRIYRMQ
jgi:hypothetical protein